MSVGEGLHLGEEICPSYGRFEVFWLTQRGELARSLGSGRPASQQPAQPAAWPPAGAVAQCAVAAAAVVPVRAVAMTTAAQRLAILSCHAHPSALSDVWLRSRHHRRGRAVAASAATAGPRVGRVCHGCA